MKLANSFTTYVALEGTKVRSEKAEQTLIDTNSIPNAGQIVFVDYDDVKYFVITNGVDAFKDLPKQGGGAGPTWTSVTGKPATFPPTIGTTATTALAGDTVIPAAATWANIAGKPAVIGAGATAAEARTAIGAGTSNLGIGTTSTTAKAGDAAPITHTQAFTTITGVATLAQLPALTIAKTTGLQAAIDAKLTATKGVAVPDAVDETDVVATVNALLASLRTGGTILT